MAEASLSPYRTHNASVHNLSYNLDFQLDTRMIKFIHSCLNHSNIVCKSIVLYKLYCIKSTFGSNYKYLPCKYRISQDDWYTNLNQLVEKVNMKCHEEIQHRNAVQTVVDFRSVPRIWEGGGAKFFFLTDFGICMSRCDMLRMAKPCALL